MVELPHDSPLVEANEVLEAVACAVPNTPAGGAAIARHLAEALAEASPDEVDLTLRRYRAWQQWRSAGGGGA